MEGSLVAYKVFTNGSVLNASEINDNLMNQSVMVFSNSTARAAALTAPTEGMLTWLEDVNRYEYRSGAGTWVTLMNPSGLVKLAQQTFTAATSIIIDNVFSATYNSYQIVVSATSSAASAVLLNYRVGGVNATTNYNHNTIGVAAATGFTVNAAGAVSARIGRWDTTGGLCTTTIHGVALPQRTYGVSLATDSSISTELSGHNHTTATAYDGFRIVVPSSTGEIRVYGLEN
jgi:hypothetical protein